MKCSSGRLLATPVTPCLSGGDVMTSVPLQLLISLPQSSSDYRKDSRDGSRASYSPTPQVRTITLSLWPVTKRRRERESNSQSRWWCRFNGSAGLMAFLLDQLADREFYARPKVGPDRFIPDRTGRLVTRYTLCSTRAAHGTIVHPALTWLVTSALDTHTPAGSVRRRIGIA